MDRLHRIFHREVRNISVRMHTRSVGALAIDMSREDMLAKMNVLEQRAEQSWISSPSHTIGRDEQRHRRCIGHPEKNFAQWANAEQRDQRHTQQHLQVCWQDVQVYVWDVPNAVLSQQVASGGEETEKLGHELSQSPVEGAYCQILCITRQTCSVRKANLKFSSCAMSVTHWLFIVASWKRN